MNRDSLFTYVFLAGFLAVAPTVGQEPWREAQEVDLSRGQLRVRITDNSDSPRRLSGLDSLFHRTAAPTFDAFDPDTPGASAGLNFEHIISGHETNNNRFTPRHGPFRLSVHDSEPIARLVRMAKDSPWQVGSTLTYHLVEPNYVDFEFLCTPIDATAFGKRRYGIFFFANYMNDVADPAIHFRGFRRPGEEESWIAADASQRSHPDWNQGGTYRAMTAGELACDDAVTFRLNTWSYDWPRIAQPYYFGRAANGMMFMLMFDRLSNTRDQIRFSVFRFKLPRLQRPAWDFQYVVNRVEPNQIYGFRGRLVWKKFSGQDDAVREFQRWRKELLADRIERLKKIGAAVFLKNGAVVEVSANRSRITDKDLRHLESFEQMTDLSLEQTEVTDAGIGFLHNLQKLEWLNLYRCQITDQALTTLKRLPKLAHLPIGGNDISDVGAKTLGTMTQLVYLGLRDTKITDRGVSDLKNLHRLTGLHLGGTNITEAGVKHLTHLKLKKLWLDNTTISDASVEELQKLKTLKELHIGNTRMTDDGRSRLSKALSQCDLYF